MGGRHDERNEFQDGLETFSEEKLDEPKMYRVILHNDDYTTMDFVVAVLMKIFRKPAAEAMAIMLDVHKRGSGVCGVYPFDIAVTKTDQVHAMARSSEYPLRCSYEEA